MASRRSFATAQEWEQHRAEIVKLYIEKEYPLRLVMSKLAKKGFKPSASQYRSRFKIWRLKKLRKPPKELSNRQEVVITAQQAATVSESGSMRTDEELWQFQDFSSTSYRQMVDEEEEEEEEEEEDDSAYRQQQQIEDEMDRDLKAYFSTLS